MTHVIKQILSCITLLVISFTSLANAQDAKVGYIHFDVFENVPPLLESLTEYFPVDTFEHVQLTKSRADDGLDAVVDEMESIVNDMKSRGINRILVGASSAETGPFIEGNAGSLANIHSDLRHPEVIFSADRQGTTSVDNAKNWYRAGIDFTTDKVLGAPVLLPDVTGVTPTPQFILATDNSPAVDQANIPFTAHALEAGYEVINVDLGWNEATETYDTISGLGAIIADAPNNSKVGLSVSGDLTRWIKLTESGLADPNIFDPGNTNVDYLGLNYQPFLGDFDDPGSLPVDVLYGVSPATPLVFDPDGANDILLKLGFPDNPEEAFSYDQEKYFGSGIVDVAAFAWLATDGASNLDSRHLIDENRQLVEPFVFDSLIPAGSTWDEFSDINLRPNPRWLEQAGVPEPTSSTLLGIAVFTTCGFCRRSRRRIARAA